MSDLERELGIAFDLERLLGRFRRGKINDKLHRLQKAEEYIDEKTFENLEPSMELDNHYTKFKELKKAQIRFTCRKL